MRGGRACPSRSFPCWIPPNPPLGSAHPVPPNSRHLVGAELPVPQHAPDNLRAQTAGDTPRHPSPGPPCPHPAPAALGAALTAGTPQTLEFSPCSPGRESAAPLQAQTHHICCCQIPIHTPRSLCPPGATPALGTGDPRPRGTGARPGPAEGRAFDTGPQERSDSHRPNAWWRWQQWQRRCRGGSDGDSGDSGGD